MKKVITLFVSVCICICLCTFLSSCESEEPVQTCTVTFNYNETICFVDGLPEKYQTSSGKKKLESVEKGDYFSDPPIPSSSASLSRVVFGGWYKEPSCENAFDFNSEPINTNITLYAKWIKFKSNNLFS
jgi:hypothetical protein